MAAVSSSDSAASDRPPGSPLRRRACPTRVQARQHPAVAFGVEQRQRELWLPPVSSNGLKRTRPTRWNARSPALSSARSVRSSRSTSRPSSWTFSRWAPRTASEALALLAACDPRSRFRTRLTRRASRSTMTSRTRSRRRARHDGAEIGGRWSRSGRWDGSSGGSSDTSRGSLAPTRIGRGPRCSPLPLAARRRPRSYHRPSPEDHRTMAKRVRGGTTPTRAAPRLQRRATARAPTTESTPTPPVGVRSR